MLKNLHTSIIIPLVFLMLSALWGLFHGVDSGIFMMFKSILVVLAIAIIEITLIFRILSINIGFIELLKNNKTKFIFFISIILINLIVITNIISYSTGMTFFKAIHNLFFNPRIYLYQTIVNENLISMYCGTYLLILSMKKIFNNFEIKIFHSSNTKNLYLLISLLVVLVVISKIPDFYKYKIIIASFWAMISYLFVEIFSKVFSKNCDQDLTQIGPSSIFLTAVSFVSLGLVSAVGAISVSSDIFIVMMGLIIGISAIYYLRNNDEIIDYFNDNEWLKTGGNFIILVISASCLLRVVGWNIPHYVMAIFTLMAAAIVFFKQRNSKNIASDIN